MPGLFLRFIGVCEVLGGLGLVLPWLLGIRPGLTSLAAAGLGNHYDRCHSDYDHDRPNRYLARAIGGWNSLLVRGLRPLATCAAARAQLTAKFTTEKFQRQKKIFLSLE